MNIRRNRPLLSAAMLATACLLATTSVKSQPALDATPATGRALAGGLYIENGGFGGILSVNFEQRFGQRLNTRLGVAKFDGAQYPLIPFGASVIVAKDRLVEDSRIELGVASLYRPEADGARRLAGAAMVATWRQQFGGGRWYYRVSYHSAQEKLWPALSFGRGI